MKTNLRTGKLAVRILSLSIITTGMMLADTISGPALSITDAGYDISGIGFTANVNSTLTSFTFNNQGKADTIDLINSSGTVLDSVTTAAGTPTDVISVNWSLTAGTQYYLLQTTSNNSKYGIWGVAAPSDSQITLTDTGDFSTTSINPANFYSDGTLFWAAFTNISTTTTSAAPEPSSFLLMLPFAAVGLWRIKGKASL